MKFHTFLGDQGDDYPQLNLEFYLDLCRCCLTILLFWIARDNYNGLGQRFINQDFLEPVSIMEFIWKIIFTAVAHGSVFQGRRENPTFFVGATFGSALAPLLKLPVTSVNSIRYDWSVLRYYWTSFNRSFQVVSVLWKF